MKILYFSLGYSTHDHRFLSAMTSGGHDVLFVQLEGNRRQVEDRPIPEGVRLALWKGGKKPFEWRDLPALILDLKRLIRDFQPDLIHAGPIQTCAFLAVLTGFRPILTMSWGFDLMDDVHRNGWWEWATRYTLKRSTYFISDANVTRDKAATYGMNPERTVVFPWGVNLEQFAPSTVDHPPSEAFTLFCNRSWEPRYGVDVLAKAFVQIAASRPEVGLILLGGGSQGANLRQILTRGGAMERVHFGGQVSQKDLPNWYHRADLYISPSHVDGSSVSLMEALACGLPCLVSDIPANQEWVREGENGWLFRDGDVDDLAAKILQTIEKRETLALIGENARTVAEARADWKKNTETLLRTYETVIRLKSEE